MKYLLLIAKNLRRNLLRTTLTALATMLLVFIITLVWTILWTLAQVTKEKEKDLKAIVTERWQIPSQMPFAYAATLSEGAAREPGDVRPVDSMTWQFFVGSIDPNRLTLQSFVFFFAMEPRKIIPMMDDAENFPPELIEKLVAKKNGAIIGKDRLKSLNRRVGDRITVTSINYKEIALEFEIVGECPAGPHDQNGFMNRDYLNDALDKYERDNRKKHPLADKSLNLVWLRVPDMKAFDQVTRQIMDSPMYTVPAVKCETASSGIAAFLEAYKDLLFIMESLLVPGAIGTMILVLANAISISVRERRNEMAVLKVLGFQPRQILILVLGEGLLLGGLAGLISAGGTYLLIDVALGGLKFPIAFFPAFYVPIHAWWWGLVIGGGTALVGSIGPALSACAVKPSEVFAKVG
jgi:putative ABC transport system permease protein